MEEKEFMRRRNKRKKELGELACQLKDKEDLDFFRNKGDSIFSGR